MPRSAQKGLRGRTVRHRDVRRRLRDQRRQRRVLPDHWVRTRRVDRDELGGRHPPRDVALDFERIQPVSGQVPNYRAEKRRRTKDGETVWTSFTATVVRDDPANRSTGSGSWRTSASASGSRRSWSGRTSGWPPTSKPRSPNCSSRAPASSRRRTWNGGGSSATSTTGRSSGSSHCACASGWLKTYSGTTPCAASSCWASWARTSMPHSRRSGLLAKGVYPAVLADRGLVEALRAAARNSPLSVTVRSPKIGRLPWTSRRPSTSHVSRQCRMRRSTRRAEPPC